MFKGIIIRFRELNIKPVRGWLGTLLVFCILMPIYTNAQDTVYFSTSDVGEIKATTEWGADTAWPSVDNMRHNITHMGVEEIDAVRLNFYVHEPLAGMSRTSPT